MDRRQILRPLLATISTPYRLSNSCDVNTSRYRHTIWYYVQSLFGVCNEEFRFDQVTKFVSFEQRAFLKACATRPFDLCAFDPMAARTVFGALNSSEIVSCLFCLLNAFYLNILSKHTVFHLFVV